MGKDKKVLEQRFGKDGFRIICDKIVHKLHSSFAKVAILRRFAVPARAQTGRFWIRSSEASAIATIDAWHKDSGRRLAILVSGYDFNGTNGTIGAEWTVTEQL